MTHKQQIIDVEPISYSGYRAAQSVPESHPQKRQATQSYQWDTKQAPRVFYVRREFEPQRKWSPLRAVGGMLQTAIGIGLVAIGIPLLLLPGPGLLTIAIGGALTVNGMGKVFA